MNYKTNIPIANLTTMRLGGAAKVVLKITKPDEITKAYDFAKQHKLPTFVLGAGSNIIGRDKGFAGVILLNQLRGISVMRAAAQYLTIQVASGEMLDTVVKFTTDRGFGGMEALSAIPGTIGAAVVQNSGAYGQDISQTLQHIEAYDTKTGKIIVINKRKCNLGYRKSIFQSSRYFITSVTLRLRKTHLKPPFYTSLQAYVNAHNITDFSPTNIRRIIIKLRSDKLPDVKKEASSGSFFHNVVVSKKRAKVLKKQYPDIPIFHLNRHLEVASGWLIEQVGLRGKTLHGMYISDKSALVLINKSAKNYTNLARAREEIVEAVYAKFGLELIQEPVELT
ncbi:UDP-N-acetylmuramate dehydrogenase [Candidatus Saccharibacteria bacterium]|nr:UDP-N-acetylmuramate dehydrogenase [Candidatus Saccharibacteria bacterium]